MTAGAPLRVLHVEDNPSDAELIREALVAEHGECALQRVQTRDDFLAALRRDRFDVILSDYALPSFDGFAALEIARNQTPDTPFILVSGTIGEEAAIESMRRGATDYVLKHRLARLGPAVRRALEEAETRRALQRNVALLRQSQKMEALGQYTGGIAHDFNNLLTVIVASADLSRAAPDRDALLDNLRDLSEAAERGKKLIKKLLAFSRREALALQRVAPVRLVRETVGTFRHLLPSTIAVGLTADDDVPPIDADPGAVEQMLLNLATNARDAMPDGGHLDVSVRVAATEELRRTGVRDPDAGRYVRVALRDSGAGMSEETRRRIFEPLFTTKPAGKGTGLGMAMVLSLAEQHHGYVNVESAPGLGTTVELYFPAQSGVVRASEPTGAPDTELRGGPETVLIADDDPAVRRVVMRTLARFGYGVLPVHDGLEALEAFRAHGATIDLVISDMTMPRMTGLELYRSLRADGSAVRFLFTSGHELSKDESLVDHARCDRCRSRGRSTSWCARCASSWTPDAARPQARAGAVRRSRAGSARCPAC